MKGIKYDLKRTRSQAVDTARGGSSMIWEISMSHDRQFIRFLVACLAVFLVSPNSSPAQELDGVPEHVVKAALNPKSEVIYGGIMRKQLMPMGDAAAVAITKVLADERTSADTVDRIFLIIEFSFDSPEAIVSQADQKPKTALFVLASLGQRPLGVVQRRHLAELTKKLKDVGIRPRS
jgi:hypothetical protein